MVMSNINAESPLDIYDTNPFEFCVIYDNSHRTL